MYETLFLNHLIVHKDHAILLKKKVILNFKLLAVLLTILYQWTNFEAPSCNNFRDILITSFQWPNLQTVITRKNTISGEKPPVKQLIILYQLTKFEDPIYIIF